jgi:hypothetical protein
MRWGDKLDAVDCTLGEGERIKIMKAPDSGRLFAVCVNVN